MTANHISPRHALSFFLSIFYKIKYGNRIQINPFKVYLGRGVRIRIGKNGKIIFNDLGIRIFIDCQCDLGASGGGILEVSGGVFMNRGCIVESRNHVRIGQNTMLAPYVRVFDNDHGTNIDGTPFRHQPHLSAPIEIGTNVWIGTGSFVCKGTIIGNSTVVGANSVARGTLDSQSVYVGNPTRLIKRLTRENPQTPATKGHNNLA